VLRTVSGCSQISSHEVRVPALLDRFEVPVDAVHSPTCTPRLVIEYWYRPVSAPQYPVVEVHHGGVCRAPPRHLRRGEIFPVPIPRRSGEPRRATTSV